MLENKWLWAAIAAIVLGYVLLAALRDTVFSPVLLVAGYCVLLPLHLWSRQRSDDRVGE